MPSGIDTINYRYLHTFHCIKKKKKKGSKRKKIKELTFLV